MLVVERVSGESIKKRNVPMIANGSAAFCSRPIRRPKTVSAGACHMDSVTSKDLRWSLWLMILTTILPLTYFMIPIKIVRGAYVIRLAIIIVRIS